METLPLLTKVNYRLLFWDFFLASVGGRVAAAIIAKFCITFSFAGIYVWCVELFPTTVR